MLAMLVTRIGEDNFWSNFLKVLSKEDAEKIRNMSNQNLQIFHDPDDLEQSLNFINQLPVENFMQFFEEIEAQIEINKK